MNTDKQTLTKRKKRKISKLTWRNEEMIYNIIAHTTLDHIK